MSNVLLRLPDVMKVTGLGRSTIYRLANQGEFPQQVKLSSRAVGWPAEAVQRWIESRINATQA